LRLDGVRSAVVVTHVPTRWGGRPAFQSILTSAEDGGWSEQLRESEARYRALSEAALEAVFIHRGGIVLEANRRVAEMTGYERSELIGMNGLEHLVPPEQRATVRQRIASPPGGIAEIELVRKDGRPIIVEYNASDVVHQGRPARVVSLRDITDQRRAAAALERSEARFRQLAENIGSVFWLADPIQSRIYYVSPAFEEIFGRPQADLYADPNAFLQAVHPDDLDRVRAASQNTSQTDVDIEYRIVRPDGAFRWVRTRSFRVEDNQGHVHRIAGITSDVTDRKRVETWLRRRNQVLERLAGGADFNQVVTVLSEATHELIPGSSCRVLQLDEDGQQLVALTSPSGSEAGDAVTQVAPDSCACGVAAFLGRRVVAADRPEDSSCARLRAQLHDRLQYCWCEPIKSSSGKVLGTFTIYSDDAEPAKTEAEILESAAQLLGIALERKRVTAQIGKLEAQLRQQQKLESIGTLASGVAHEINNPIQGILSYAELIRIETAPDSNAYEYAGDIITESDRIATIVRNLLAFARRDREERGPVRVPEEIEAALSLIRAVLRKDRISLEVDVPTDLPAVRCGSQELQQVVMNLLTNARDALNLRYLDYHLDKLIRVTARERSEDGGGWVRITVEDRGTGIHPNHIDRIFDPFFTTKGNQGGTGLGLSVSHGIVTKNRGRLLVESTLGEGTRFHLDLRVDGG
jgi:PAS domain S-box-containing protein